MSVERERVDRFGPLDQGLTTAGEWVQWGPYLSERQWGTVREDYSADGDAWRSFPHDHARSRAYRWGEDGLAGFSDIEQRLCLALALWNGRDPILKERVFGLTGHQGNHGEDAKEHWWYLDAVPSHVWNRWRLRYPQGAFPYDDLVAENARRTRAEPPYGLLDTGAFEVFAIDGGRDLAFLRRVFDKLLVNFTWWVNREDVTGSNLFEGGFLGLDNIGPLDRDHVPVAGILQQSDATAWMGVYALHMAGIASTLARHGEPTLDLVVKFLEHFAAISEAIEHQGLWNEADGFYDDRLLLDDGTAVPIAVRSIVGVLPVLASAVLDEASIARSERLGKQFAELARRASFDLAHLGGAGEIRGAPGDRHLLMGLVPVESIDRVLSRVLDEDEMLSPHGIRALSRWHRDHPYELVVGDVRATIDYEPGESTTPMFGGNSNWRGPVWFPVNHLLISSIERYGAFFGDTKRVEHPTGSGRECTLTEVADDLRGRLISLFVPDADGHRPCFGRSGRFAEDPRWSTDLLFHEYFHGDTGQGLGASHQTGWTALVADLIRRRRRSATPAPPAR